MNDPLLDGCPFRLQLPYYFLSSLYFKLIKDEPTVFVLLIDNPSTKFLLINQNIVEWISKVIKSLANFNNR